MYKILYALSMIMVAYGLYVFFDRFVLKYYGPKNRRKHTKDDDI